MTTTKNFLFLWRLAAVSLLLFICVLPAAAQTNRADITGTVTDTAGAVVPDATVTITNVDTNAERTVTTNSDGVYVAPFLEIGNYRVSVTAPNFQTTTRENIRLQTSDRLAVDVQIAAGGVGTNEVTVTAEAPLIQTETSERGSIVTGREVTELPLNGRNFTQLATLTPGVSRVTIGTLSDARANNNGDPNAGGQGPGGGNPVGSTESARFARSGGAVISANGQRPTNNNFSVDGVDNNEPQFGTIGVFVNPDAIAEFRVTTSVPPAEVGRAAGAVVNTSFKSGTNNLNGSLYYYGQNSALNAFAPLIKRDRANQISSGNPNPVGKAVQQIHEFGGTVGGPVFLPRFGEGGPAFYDGRNKTFFFFSFLGARNNLPQGIRTTVPALGVVNGNFNAFTVNRDCNADGDPDDAEDGPVCDPLTGRAFANNQIPVGRFSPVALNFLRRYPQPSANVNDPNDGGNRNFFGTRNVGEDIDNYDIKIDQQIGSNNQLSGRFSDQKNLSLRDSFLPDVPAGFGNGVEDSSTRQVVLNNTTTFSPTVLNNFRFGYTTINVGILNCGVGGACGFSPSYAADTGVPNVNDGSFEQTGSILFGGFGTGALEFAGDGGPFLFNSKNPYFADTLTVVKGSQVFKFGGEVRLRYLETINGGRAGGLKGNLGYDNRAPLARRLATGQTCPTQSQTTLTITAATQTTPAVTAPGCFVDINGTPYGGTGLAISNILLATAPNFGNRGAIPGGAFNVRSQELGFFVQDDWKVNDSLTLNLGLRYDLFPSGTEASGRLGNFDLAARRVILASDSSDRLIETDKNNFGPRLGFAYALNDAKTFVVRGGYGLLYTLDATDSPPLVQNPPFSGTIGFGNNGNRTDFNDNSPRTNFNLQTGPPSVPPGAFADPANVPEGVTVFFVEPQQRTGKVHQFQITTEYQFTNDLAFNIGYVGNRSRNLLATRAIGRDGTAEARNAAGQFLNATAYENRASASYDSLQAQLVKRLSRNVSGQFSYTYSHNIDDSTGVFQGVGEGRGSAGGPQNPFDLAAERGNSSLDVRHLVSANAIIDLPFGQGQRFFNSSNSGSALNRLVSGFQLNIIVLARTGFPFTVVDGDNGSRRATLIGDPFANVPAGRFFNRAAFGAANIAVTNAAGNTIRFGSLGRNTFTSPGFNNTSLSLFKNTRITEGTTLQFGIEAFNAFNQAIPTVPNNNFRNDDFGRFDAFQQARVFQYRLKYLF